MIKKLLFILAVLSVSLVKAQDNTSSPYSYYGIGLNAFSGSAENRAMGGMAVDSDSIHFNFQNPAALGTLKLTTFSVGGNYSSIQMKEGNAKARVRNTSFDYLGVGIPTKWVNFGFGLVPGTAVGYNMEGVRENALNQVEGTGGLNTLFLSASYKMLDNKLRLGIEGNYNFGKIETENYLFQEGIEYGSFEGNRSDLSGFRFKLGAQYEHKLKRDFSLKTSLTYAPKTRLSSQNSRKIGTIASTTAGPLIVFDQEISLEDTKFDMPQEFTIGVGLGKFQKWFIGLEYKNQGKGNYRIATFLPDNLVYKKSDTYRIGGYYTPNYTDISSYFKRVTYRAGLRYEQTGLNINQKDINEFGMSFGLGLPAGQFLSNVNLGVEYGQRGTTTANLVKENFVNIFIGISLNDRWFIERRFK